MRKTFSTSHRFQQRLFLVVISCFFSLLLMRLYHLQVVAGSFYRSKADGNRFYTRHLAEERGVFFDRFGDPLVVNVPKYYKLADRSSLYSQREAISHQAALHEMVADVDGVEYEIERHYLFPESTAHVLGYVSSVTADEIKSNPDLPISSKIGKMGLEKVYDDEIRGHSGTITYEINALGKKQRTVAETPGTPGQNISTTLDPYLSEVAYRALGDQRGAIVILDADTGGVLSLVNAPTYNTTLLSKTGITSAEELQRRQKVATYFTNPLKPFFDRAVAGTYPPGSVFKLVTAMAGLEQNVLEESTTVRDEGVLEVGEYSYANWYFTQYGRVEGDINIVRSLARSNDIFFYKTAEWVGAEKLGEYARLFGFGERTGIELPGEAAGLVPTPEWKEQTIGEKWFLGNTFHMGIGQGDVLVSPLQVASSVQALAKRGARCAPRTVLPQESGQIQKDATCTELGFSEKNLDLVMLGMLDACSSGGTAFPFFTHNDAVRNSALDPYEQIQNGAVACKTGTSEFGSADSRGYRKTHAWFASVFAITADMKNAGLPENSVDLEATVSASQTQDASESALTSSGTEVNTLSLQESQRSSAEDYTFEELYQMWSKKIKEQYPKRVVVVVLVESDESQPYKEGSRDAAPLAKHIYDWMSGKMPADLE